MDTCFTCKRKAAMECVACSVLLCEEDAINHMMMAEDHMVKKLKPFVASDAQKNASANIINQLEVIDQYYIEITQAARSIVKEITRLVEESLQQLHEKRVILLDHLTRTSKRISAQELKELQAISDVALVKQTACLDSAQSQLRHYFQAYKSFVEPPSKKPGLGLSGKLNAPILFKGKIKSSSSSSSSSYQERKKGMSNFSRKLNTPKAGINNFAKVNVPKIEVKIEAPKAKVEASKIVKPIFRLSPSSSSS